jgi:hypothetical protein
MTGQPAGARNEAGRTDSLVRSWREIVSLQNSARQFNARLMRTAPRVAELAVAYPALRDAHKVVNVLVHNLSLAQDVLERMPLPEELAEAVT